MTRPFMNRLGNGIPLVHIHVEDETVERVENALVSLVVLSLTGLVIVATEYQRERLVLIREMRAQRKILDELACLVESARE